MCRALLVAQGRHPTWRTYSARRVAPGRLLVDQAKKSHLGLYTVLSELSANTKLAWRAVHGRGPAIAVAKSPSHQEPEPNSRAGSFFIRDRGRMRNPEIILMVQPLSGR